MGRKTKEVQYIVTSSGCHECISHCTDTSGYPLIYRNRKQVTMSRWLYEKSIGKIPKGFVIRHKCDNPKCINIDHLEIGTQKDNVQDMMKRGRNGYKTIFTQGSTNPSAKLDESKVRNILEQYSSGNKITKIAFEYGVSAKTISNIVHHKKWQHIGEPNFRAR